MIRINCPMCGEDVSIKALKNHLEGCHDLPTSQVEVKLRLHPTSPYLITKLGSGIAPEQVETDEE